MFGYRVLTSRNWAEDETTIARGPSVAFSVDHHFERGGHTWYIVKCKLRLPAEKGDKEDHTASSSSSSSTSQSRETLDWEAPRRLLQLRSYLHDPVKFNFEASEYNDFFGSTPFAHTLAPSGTTARLSGWLSSLATAINKRDVSPAMAALTLSFLHVPIPPKLCCNII
eukprot:TRINITY_DN52302_c0_g1_i1.p1 TRINITY_DN52302_c0_g1~~TRINITY_DN52302_c0_g1_i1.p1  ORF type:complete len:187 (-),score=20.92 TRINITY_DN52302_c0_g1_i1:116-619(-)